MSSDPNANPPTFNSTAPPPPPPAHTDQPDWSAYTRIAMIAAIGGLAIYLIAGLANVSSAHDQHAAKTRFGVAYLSGFIYWFSLPLGAMALLMIRYVAKTSWGLLLCRPLEAATRTLPLFVVLFLPLAVLVVSKDLSPYWWSAPEHAEVTEVKVDPNAPPEDKRTQTIKAGLVMKRMMIEERKKEDQEARDEGTFGFLSPAGFIVVGVVLFGIWGTMIYFLNKWGKEASDATDRTVIDRNLEKLQNISGPGLIVFAITITAAATQWVMSLEPGWASTMFPVIFTINQFLTCFAFCLALFLLLASRPPFAGHMRPKFQLDMGTLMLAFTLFWSYTSFSQYMLVWIGNLPEEIPFYLKRSNYDGGMSGWWYVSAALIALHFALPFLLLLFRDVKLHPVRLRWVATYLLVICAVDVVWWIAPSATPHGNFPSWLMDVGAIIGVGGVWGLYFVWQLKQRPLFPDNQAFLLPEGHHEHH
ncbi:MAG: hypothetical protein L0241_14290 [Planctomycetia bacterium]|nr:hypothetical protein [Planctomycetia bacterium]